MPSPLELLESKYRIIKKKVGIDIDPLTSLERKYKIPTIPTVKDPLEALEKKYAIQPFQKLPGYEVYAKPPYVRVTAPKEITLKDELKKAGKETLKEIGFWASGVFPWNWSKEQFSGGRTLFEWHDTIQDGFARFLADPSEYDEAGNPTLFPKVRAELLMGVLLLECVQGVGAIKRGIQIKKAEKQAMKGLVEKMGRVRTESELAEFGRYLKSQRTKDELRQLIYTWRRLSRKFLRPVKESIHRAKEVGKTIAQRRMELRRLTVPEREMYLRGKLHPIYEPGEIPALREEDVIKRIEETVRREVEIKTNLEKMAFEQRGKRHGLRVERPAYITQQENLDLFPNNILVVKNIPTAEGKVGAAIVNTEAPSVRLFKDAFALERELINISVNHITTKTATFELVKGHIEGKPRDVEGQRELARYQGWLETRAKYIAPREKVTKPPVVPPVETPAVLEISIGKGFKVLKGDLEEYKGIIDAIERTKTLDLTDEMIVKRIRNLDQRRTDLHEKMKMFAIEREGVKISTTTEDLVDTLIAKTIAKPTPPKEIPEEVAPPIPEVTPKEEALAEIKTIMPRIKELSTHITASKSIGEEIDPKVYAELERLENRVSELQPKAYPKIAEKVRPEVITKAPISPKAKPMKIETVTKTAQKVIDKRATLPILSNVLVKDGNLIATDLEVALVVKTDKPDGLYKFIGKNLEKSELPVEDFPIVPYPPTEIGKISSREEFITNLERALRFVSTDETRYVITGPLLNVKNGKGEIIATDGRILSTSDIALENFKDGKYIIASPNKVLNALKGISGESLTVKTDKDKHYLSFEGDNGLVVVRLIEGAYPDYTKAFPKLNQQYIVNKGDLSSALKILKPYAQETYKIAPPVDIEWVGKNLVLTAGKEETLKVVKIPGEIQTVSYTPDKGTIIMPMRDGDKPGKQRLNINYLIDATKSVKTETVFMGSDKEVTWKSPLHIYGEDLSKVKPIKVAEPVPPEEFVPPIGEVRPTIPVELEPLAKEARKYKRVEEFMKSLETTATLGTSYEKRTQRELIDKLWKVGFKSLTQFYKLVTKEVKPPEIEEIVAGKKITSIEEIPEYRRDWSISEYDMSITRTEGIIKTGKAPDITSYHIPHLERLKAEREFLKSQAKPTTPEEEVMMNGGEEIEDYEAGGQQFPPTEEIVRRQAYEKHIMRCLQGLAEMAPKDMATNKQKALAHILAQKKKLTQRQLRRLEKIITGLTTMGPLTPTGRIKKTYMTKQQAGELIKALHRFFVPAYKKPTIPRGKLTAKDLQVIKTDLMKKPMRRVDVARLIKNARKVIRDPQFRPHFVDAYWEWVNSLRETGIGPKVLSMDVWSPRIEKRTGLPIYTGIYLPFEDAARGLKVATMKFWKEVEGIWGKHLKSPEPEDGDLALRVHHALIGDEEYFVDAPLTNEELEIVRKAREFYDKYFTEFDIGNYTDYYSPRIREAGGARAAYIGRIPKELRFFAELERVGLLSPLIEDERILMRIYFYAGARKKHYGPPLKQAAEIKRFLPPNTLNAVDSYIGQKLGYGTKGQRVLEKTIENIMQSLKIELPPQLLTSLYFTSIYGGALGFRLHPIVRNAFQTFLMGYPEYGKWLAPGLKKSFLPSGISKWRKKGFLVDWGVPYGEEIDRAIEGVGSSAERLINLYRKFVRVGLIPYGKWIDTLNRANMANACESRFNHWLKRYKDGEISLKKFAKKINLKGEDEFVQREVINHIQNKDYEKALDRLVGIGIDNTQWPYRKGVGPQWGYGLGKFASTFWVWPHRYGETLVAKWIARRQWGKIWRWLLVGYAMKKLGDRLKVSVLKWVHLGPLYISLTPAINTAYHLAGIVKATSWGNRRELDEHLQDLKRSAPVFIGYGIFARNIYEFLKAAENNFVYYDKRGRYKYQLTLTEALLRAGGFIPKGLQKRWKLTGKFYNEEYLMKKAKRDIKDMYLTGRHKEATKNYRKFIRRYKEVYVPLYKLYVRKYGKDYMKRTGREVPIISPFIMPELKGMREQK